MKKKLLIALPILAAAVAFAMQGCKKPAPGKGEDGEYTVDISDPTLQLDVLDRVDISATVKNSAGETADSQITWDSSDKTVVTVSDGTLNALKAGTAKVTATAEGKTAECEVTVSATVRPLIIVTPTEITLTENKTSKISPSVKFKSRTLDNSEYNITYSYVSSADEFVAVASDGTITAKKATVDPAEITVTAAVPLATSAGIDGELTKKISVSVERDFKLTLALKEGEDTDIYLKGVTDGGATYKETSRVELTEASLNGEEITSGWTFKSSDSNVATVTEEGVIALAATAEKDDKVKIYAEYEKDGDKFKSNEIEFTVCKATVDKTLASELMLDLSVNNLTVHDELFGSDFEITDLKDGEKPAVSLWNGDNGTVKKEAVTGFGKRELTVESQKINYRVEAWVVSKVITTAQQITDLFNPASGTAVPTVDGYYVLGNDIDASGAVFKERSWTSGGAGVGLVGTFDGRGHTVDGLNLTGAYKGAGGGVFGSVSPTGTVKNVAFTNVSVNGETQCVILAFSVKGTIENVFVGVNEFTSTSASTNHVAGLIGQADGAATLKNIVLVLNPEISVDAAKKGALAANNNNGKWENIFAVTGDNLFGGSNAGDSTSGGQTLNKFATVGELLASEYYNGKKTEYPEEIWDIASMTFKTSASYIKAELQALGTAKELKVGEAAAIVKNSRLYNLSTESDKLSIAGGKITASEKITAQDNVTVTVEWGGVQKVVAITAANPAVTIDHGYYSYNKGDLTVTDEAFNGIGAVSSVKIGETDLTDKASGADNTLTIQSGAIGKSMYGPQELTVKGENRDVTVKITVAHELTSKADVLNLYDYLNASGTVYSGYLILGGDVDMENATIRNKTAGQIAKTASLDFAGVFDGQGHKISNYEVPDAGSAGISIFSTVSGTIKNLRIEDVTVSGKGGALVGNQLIGSGKLENIYVSGTIAGDGIKTGDVLRNVGSSLLVGRMIVKSVKISNVIVNANVINPDALVIGSAFGVANTGHENTIFENCFVICGKDNFAYRKQGSVYTMEATPNVPADWTLQAFNTTNGKGNNKFANIAAAWKNETAAGILTGLGLTNSTN